MRKGFDPNEPRDSRGRWVRVSVPATEIVEGDRLDISGKTRVVQTHTRGDSVLLKTQTTGARTPSMRKHLAEEQVHVFRKVTPEDLVDAHALKAPPKYRPNPKTVSLNDQPMSMDAAVKLVGSVYSWGEMDEAGGGDATSVDQQHRAQIAAKVWAETVSWEDAPVFWMQYQGIKEYPKIQKNLRNTKARSDMVKVDAMFNEGGWTTEKPMTVYHAIKSQKDDWSARLKVGSVFTDKGMISTTANEKFAYGWLLGDAEGNDVREPSAKDVVIEIRLPVGTRVVGGDPGFIETMLHPDTHLKVISAQTESSGAVDPIDHAERDVTYTHVVAEVVPDGS
jgi:hypothetical protein